MLAVCIPRSSNTPSNSLIVLSVPIFSIDLREFLIKGTEWAMDWVTLDVRQALSNLLARPPILRPRCLRLRACLFNRIAYYASILALYTSPFIIYYINLNQYIISSSMRVLTSLTFFFDCAELLADLFESFYIIFACILSSIETSKSLSIFFDYEVPIRICSFIICQFVNIFNLILIFNRNMQL